MRRIIAILAFPLIALLASCHVFLGPEPDTEPRAVLRSLWNDFNEIHAYIDIRMSNNPNFESWDAVYEYYDNRLLNRIQAGSPSGDRVGAYLFEACRDMIGELMDPHVSLFAPGGNFFWGKSDESQKREEQWFSLAVVREYLQDEGFKRGIFFTFGIFNKPYDTIGYIHIASFIDSEKLEQPDWAEEIDGIMEFFQSHGDDIKAIVIDIRNNSGGSGQLAEYIAARFTSVQQNYMKTSVKNGPGRNQFSSPMTFRVKPEGTRFTKHIALLTNKGTVSAAEWFAMALRTQRHVRHVGTPTRGAFSPKIARPMINGWYYTISAFMVTDMNGTCFEGKGLSPDAEFIFKGSTEENETTTDPVDVQLISVLEEVLKWVNP